MRASTLINKRSTYDQAIVRTLGLLFLCTCWCISTSAQQLIDKVETEKKDSIFVQLEQQYRTAISDSAKVTSLVALAEYQVNRNFSEAEGYLLEAVAVVNQNEELKAGGYLAPPYSILGIVNRRQGNYAEAIDYFLKAKTTFERIKDSSNVANILHNMGMVYRSLGDYERSIASYKSAINILETLDENHRGMAAGYNMLGVSYRKTNQLDSAMYCYSRAKEIFKQLGNEEDLYRVNGNLAVLHYAKKRYDESLELNFENVDYYKKVGNKTSLTTAYYNISSTYKKLEDWPKALKYSEKSLVIAQKEGIKKRISRAYLRIAAVLYIQQHYKDAYDNYKQHKIYADSLLNDENLKKIQRLELENTFRREKLQDSLKLVQEREQVEDKAQLLLVKNKVKSQWILFGGLGVMVIMSFMYFAYKQRLKLAKLKNQLLNTEMEFKKKDMANLAINISETQHWARSLLAHLEKVKVARGKQLKQQLEDMEVEIRNKTKLDNNAEDLQLKIDTLSSGFYEKLNKKYPNLTPNEIRLCSFIRMDMNTKEIATLQNIDPQSVKRGRNRLRKKLQLDPKDDLSAFLRSFY